MVPQLVKVQTKVELSWEESVSAETKEELGWK
jgi:hypothetical protein